MARYQGVAVNSLATPDLIQLRQVVKRYKTSSGEYLALRGVHVNIPTSEFVAIVGKSGSGKSTLLNMITGIDHPTSGEVLVNGVNIYKMTESERALWRGRNIGIVFQFFQLMPMLTLLENTMLPMDYCNVFPAGERLERAMQLLKMVGLQDQANKMPAAVSQGQQQTAAIARALATDPPIIVADEPTGNLDSRSAGKIIELFDDLVMGGKTIILVTHDPSITKRTSRTLIISDGEIVNETVAKALPTLSHTQMLTVSHHLEHLDIPSGGTILHRGQTVEYFFIVVRGKVEIYLNGSKRSEISLGQLGAGEFFGEIEMIHGGEAIANVRAIAGEPVKLIALPHKEFAEMLVCSPHTEEALSSIIHTRLAQNRAEDRRHRWW
jgi:ABC-type lipoprotein export system ATPase subunit